MSDQIDSYQSRQRDRDEEYRREYDEWLASMSPEERKRVEAMGLAKPYLPCGSGGAIKDAAESSRARCEDTFEESEEPVTNAPVQPEPSAAEPSEHYPQAADTETIHEILRKLVGEMQMQSNLRLSLDCLALVTGIVYEGYSMTDIAERHGLTRAAVSKRCIELTTALNLKPNRAMRSLLARENYSKARMHHLRINP